MKHSRVKFSVPAVAAALVLSGCGAGADESGSESESVSIRVGHVIATSSPLHAGAVKFQELIEESSDGRITVEIFPASQLGSEVDMIEQTRSGALDIVLASPAVLSNVYPDAAILAMPFVLEGSTETEHYESLLSASESDVMQEISEEMAAETGLRALDWTWWYGDRHITNSVRPIEEPSDLAGLKIRTPDAAIHFLALDALGASVTPLAFSELYLALQTGTVDGQENPLSTVESQKLYEVQDHLALTGHLSQAEVVLFSENIWQTLAEEDQELIRDAIVEAGIHQSELTIEENDGALQRLVDDFGMQVTEVDVDELREATKDAATIWAEENDGFSIERYEAFVEAQ